MPAQARLGDLIGGTGVITGPGAPTVLVNDLIISTIGDIGTSHGEPPHTNPVIETASPTVFAMDQPVTVQFISVASCGHSVTTGAPTVFTNN